MKKLRFKSRMKEEFFETKTMGKVISFEWAKMKSDTYIIFMPKMFRAEEGGSIVIVSEKRMMRMLDIHKKNRETMFK